jgi:hypothetical protein
MFSQSEQSTPAGERGVKHRRLRNSAIVVVVLLLAFYILRMMWLSAFATEGAVPNASVITLPPGSEIVRSEVECASGGCWNMLLVRPPQGQTPDGLAKQIGATPTLKIAPNLFDPRTTWVTSTSVDSLLELHLDFWTGPPTP